MLKGISSMATRALLVELAGAYLQHRGRSIAFESVGGVDAARRVREGEVFDVVVLAADAVDALAAAGCVVAASRVDLVRSSVAIAVRAGAARPDIGSPQALRAAIRAARRVGYSTGPSGVALVRLLDSWAETEDLRDRLVQAPPGVAVAELLARGEVDLGFQQLSELINRSDVDVLGTMPIGTEISTTFAAACGAHSVRRDEVADLLAYFVSDATADAKRRHGMRPA